MSRVAEILAAKRAAQIASLEGAECAGPTEDEIAAAQDAARKAIKKKPTKTKKLRLQISDHARRRMGQRRMGGDIPHLIWRYGQTLASRDQGVTHFVVSDKALCTMDGWARKRLESFRRCGVVVADAQEDRDPVLVTLIRYDRLHLDYSIW